MSMQIKRENENSALEWEKSWDIDSDDEDESTEVLSNFRFAAEDCFTSDIINGDSQLLPLTIESEDDHGAFSGKHVFFLSDQSSPTSSSS